CVQLRDTNNPIGLIFYFSVSPSLPQRGDGIQRRQKISKTKRSLKCWLSLPVCRYQRIKSSLTTVTSDLRRVTSSEQVARHVPRVRHRACVTAKAAKRPCGSALW